MKHFCSSQETGKIIKGSVTYWEDILANHISYKGLVSIIYKDLSKLNNKKTNKLIKTHG